MVHHPLAGWPLGAIFAAFQQTSTSAEAILALGPRAEARRKRKLRSTSEAHGSWFRGGGFFHHSHLHDLRAPLHAVQFFRTLDWDTCGKPLETCPAHGAADWHD
jgi:hypothetical protein